MTLARWTAGGAVADRAMTDDEASLEVARQLIGDMMREVWRAGEAVKFYLRQDNYAPWTSPTSAVRAAWETLTSPENLKYLRAWKAHLVETAPMNPFAMLVARKALADCEPREGAAARTNRKR
jgi:hypothetical protein